MAVQFTLKVADIPVAVICLYESTRSFCRGYLTEEPAQIHLTVTRENIDRERKELPEASDGQLEITALLRLLAERLLPEGLLFFHGCCVVADGEGYLFTAPSGTGKSTHARLWLKNIPGSWILNGDKPFLGIRDGVPTVFGTPWKGKEGWGENASVPLKAICIVTRGAYNWTEPITVNEAFPRLLTQSFRPDSMELLPVVQFFVRLGDKVSYYRMTCNMEDEAALVSWRAMKN